jgi:hypothetical protein
VNKDTTNILSFSIKQIDEKMITVGCDSNDGQTTDCSYDIKTDLKFCEDVTCKKTAKTPFSSIKVRDSIWVKQEIIDEDFK